MTGTDVPTNGRPQRGGRSALQAVRRCSEGGRRSVVTAHMAITFRRTLAAAAVALASSPALAQPVPSRSAPAAVPAASRASSIDPAMLAGLRWRSVGPTRGGRVTTVTGVASEPFTFYFGGVGGGVWKTEDAGTTWRNLTDAYFTEGSVGAVEVAPSDARVVYVGTGSDAIRSNVSTGRGVYRSADAGRTWAFAGLRGVGQIGGVRVDPRDANVAVGDRGAGGDHRRVVARHVGDQQ